ncbi:MAG: DUF559 domain-containing protein [Pseudoxanthomonas sp.]|nr:DUF559 domain-containing protein [Pseudoxanthomonas sp.]
MDPLRQRARKLRNVTTDAECRLWQHLKPRQLGGSKFRRQFPIAGYIADFLCHGLKLTNELDGGQHGEPATYEQRRTAVLETRGYQVLRYWNHDVLLQSAVVLEDILGVMDSIQAQSKSSPPQSSPALCAREAKSNSKNNHESEGSDP